MPFSLAAGVGAKTSLGSVLPEWTTLFDATLLVLLSGFCFAVAAWRDAKRPDAVRPRNTDARLRRGGASKPRRRP